MPTIILTDLGNVLCTFADRRAQLAKIFTHFGGDPKGVEEVFPDVSNAGPTQEGIYHRFDLGSLTLYSVWRQLCLECSVLQQVLPYHIFLALWAAHLEPIKPVLKSYKQLQEKRGVEFVVVSNGDFGARLFAERVQILHGLHFRKIFVSCQEGIKKPNLLTEHVMPWMASQGIKPGNCVFVDDLEAYTSAAEKAGIVKRAGSWYQYDKKRLGQGLEGARTYLKENPEVAKAIRVELFRGSRKES